MQVFIAIIYWTLFCRWMKAEYLAMASEIYCVLMFYWLFNVSSTNKLLLIYYTFLIDFVLTIHQSLTKHTFIPETLYRPYSLFNGQSYLILDKCKVDLSALKDLVYSLPILHWGAINNSDKNVPGDRWEMHTSIVILQNDK